jgi:hypothetical protein
MLQKKRRRSWPLQAKQRRRDDRTVTLSQIVHLGLRCMFESDASFDRQRRPYAPILQPVCVCDDPHGSVFCQPQRDRAASLSARMIVTQRVA